MIVAGTNTVFAEIGKPWMLGLASPLKQFESGVKVQDVKCQPYYFTLIIKSEDGSPKCVKSDTAQKLIERGWATTLHGIDAFPNPPIGLYNVTITPQPII